MKVGIQTWGSEGDINPFIALASGLSKAGHEVTPAITSADRKDYKAVSEQRGFNLGPVDRIGSSEEALNNIGKRMIETAKPLDQLKLIYDEMFEPGVASMYRTAKGLCEENEIIIGHFIHHPLHTAAEISGKPYITVTLNHGVLPTRFAPPMGVPNLGKWFNELAWKFSEKMISRTLLPFINELRRKEGLREAKSFRDVWESPLCNLIAVSPVLCPPRDDWGENQKVCGFFRMDNQVNEYEMPEKLMTFLDGGPPPVYMTLGSMTGTQNNALMITETTRLLFDAARLAGCRAVIQSRWKNVSGIPEDENIFRVDSAPYAEVFPKCAAVVHHGGAGTTQTATLCGCPSVVIAHIPDQFLWGSELKRLGIAPNVLNRRSVTPKKIADGLRRILNNPAMTDNAKKVGTCLAREDGVTNAVKIIDHQFSKGRGVTSTGSPGNRTQTEALS
jgi:sterol 3beta-glucosyltransferase